MFEFFTRLGSNKNNQSNQVEKDTAHEALRRLKDRTKDRGPCVRFFKPESRYSIRSFVEVDENAALEKITADIYRRMESAKCWLSGWTDEDYSTTESRLGKAKPVSQGPPEASTKKRKHLGRTPESLPFLSNIAMNVADIICREELRSKRRKIENDNSSWQHEEVVNFFRGLYIHKWNEWVKVSKMMKTRSEQSVKSYATNLEAKFPELVDFFTKRGKKKKEKQGVNRSGDIQVSRGTNLSYVRKNNSPVNKASTMGSMKSTGTGRIGTKPKVVIGMGDHIIDTEAEPWVLKPSFERKRTAGSLPDCFDPFIRPTIPTINQQIYIPGNNVYARWMNKFDPGSYGTWYPGFIYASRIAPIQDKNYQQLFGVPNLLYHVKFDDGAESIDLDTDDIMMRDQYLEWLKDLEHYYSLPMPDEIRSTRLSRNQRVYAKWIDPTDPELNGCWMPGKILSSRTWQGKDGHNIMFRYTYHIFFNNGDEDEDVFDVLPKNIYKSLLSDKMERSTNKPLFSGMSGFDLIAEASKLSSPIKPNAIMNGSDEEKKESRAESDEDSLVNELRCYDVLKPRPPSPSNVARISSTPSPDVHYGIYMKLKPWPLEHKAEDRTFSMDVNTDEPSEQICDSNAVQIKDVASELIVAEGPE